jgi:nucleotide-binding universal stress UspA family protein
MKFQKILVPLSGSTNSGKVLAWVTGLAEKLKAGLILLTVAGPDETSNGAQINEAGDDSAQVTASYLKKQVEALRESGITVTAAVEPGTPAQAMIAVSDRLDADISAWQPTAII